MGGCEFQASLRDAMGWAIFPALKRPAIFGRPYGTGRILRRVLIANLAGISGC
jgi:hypothetical protein